MSSIFRTIHGSRLYGFAHEGSDYDWFEVDDDKRHKVRHKVVGSIDVTLVGIDHFLTLSFGGSHQSVEALFSPEKEWAETDAARRWRPMLEAMRVAGPDVFAKYERTIHTFCYGDFKRRRHACRLASNLQELRSRGRFNPVASVAQVGEWGDLANRHHGERLASILGVATREGRGGGNR